MSFELKIDDVDAVTKIVTVSFPDAHFANECEQAMKKAVGAAQLKGFRPGKAPRHLVEQMHGERVRWDVKEKLVRTSFSDLIEKNKLNMVGKPTIEFVDSKAGEGFQYKASISIYPEPEITGYEKFKATVTNPEVTDKDIDAVVERIRESKAETKPVSGRTKVDTGDVAHCSVVVKEAGKDGGKAQPIHFVVGKGEIAPFIDEAVLGMNIGEVKNITPPEPKEKADKEADAPPKVVFELSLNEIHERILPEVTDAWVATVEKGITTILELRGKIREMLEKERTKQARTEAETEILKVLCEVNQFPIPQVMIDNDIIDILVREGHINPKETDLEQFDVAPFRKELGIVSERRVRGAIIIDRIGEKEQVRPAPEDVEEWTKNFAASAGVDVKEAREYLGREGKMSSVFLEIGRKKILDLLHSRTEITYRTAEATEEKGEKKKKKKG